jgi:Zn-dependent peptidase ImmA (M78 family)
VVDKLLALAQSSEPPLPIESIARLRGVHLRCIPYEGDLKGLLLWENGSPVIGINALHSRIEQRFAIAHELAHLELRHHSGMHIDRSFPVPLRTESFLPHMDLNELEASVIATELLIPTALLSTDLKGQVIDYMDDTVVHTLAERYQVSAQVMLLRLAQARFITWETR